MGLGSSGAGPHGRSCVIMSPLEITDGLGGIMGGWCQVWDQESGTTCLASKGWDLKFEIRWLGTGVWDPMSWATGLRFKLQKKKRRQNDL